MTKEKEEILKNSEQKDVQAKEVLENAKSKLQEKDKHMEDLTKEKEKQREDLRIELKTELKNEQLATKEAQDKLFDIQNRAQTLESTINILENKVGQLNETIVSFKQLEEVREEEISQLKTKLHNSQNDSMKWKTDSEAIEKERDDIDDELCSLKTSHARTLQEHEDTVKSFQEEITSYKSIEQDSVSAIDTLDNKIKQLNDEKRELENRSDIQINEKNSRIEELQNDAHNLKYLLKEVECSKKEFENAKKEADKRINELVIENCKANEANKITDQSMISSLLEENETYKNKNKDLLLKTYSDLENQVKLKTANDNLNMKVNEHSAEILQKEYLLDKESKLCEKLKCDNKALQHDLDNAILQLSQLKDAMQTCQETLEQNQEEILFREAYIEELKGL